MCLSFLLASILAAPSVKMLRLLRRGVVVSRTSSSVPKLRALVGEKKFDWGRQIRGAGAESILKLFARHGKGFGAEDLATAAHRAVKRGGQNYRKDPRIFALAEACRLRIEDFSALDLSKTAWAFAKAGVRAPELFEAIGKAALLHDFDAKTSATLAWSFAITDFHEAKLFDKLATSIMLNAATLNTLEFVNVACAYSKKDNADRLFGALALELSRFLPQMNVRQLNEVSEAFHLARDRYRGEAIEVAHKKLQQQMRYQTIIAEGSTDDILTLIVNESEKLTSRHLAMGVHRLVKRGDALRKESRRLLEVAEVCRLRLDTFNSIEIASTAWGFAKAGVLVPALFEALSVEAVKQMDTFNSRSLVSTAWSFAKAGHKPKNEFYAGVAKAAKINELKSQELVNLAWAFAKANARHPLFFEEIAKECEDRRLKGFSSQGLANLAWAFTYARVISVPSSFFEKIAKEIALRIDELKPIEIVNTVWAFSMLKAVTFCPEVFEAIGKEAQTRLSDFNAQGIVNVARAFAMVPEVAAPGLFEAIKDEALQRLPEFHAKGLPTLAWAFATKKSFSCPELFDGIAYEAAGRIKEFTSQSLASFLWSFTTADVSAPGLFEAIAEEGSKRIEEFTSQELANMAWAFARMEVSTPHLFERIAETALERVPSLTALDLRKLAWAFGKAGFDAPDLIKSIAQRATLKIKEFSEADLANLAWAVAVARIDAPELFEAIAEEALKSLHNFKAFYLALMARAFAESNVAAPRLFEAIAKEAALKVKDFTGRQLADLTDALESVGHCPQELYEAIAKNDAQIPGYQQQMAWGKAMRDAPDSDYILDLVHEKGHRFSGRNLAQAAQRLARNEGRSLRKDHRFFVTLAEASLNRVNDLNATELALMASAFAKADLPNVELYAAISQRAVAKMSDFNARDMSSIAWAFAIQNFKSPPLFEALANNLDLSTFSATGISRIAYAFASTNYLDDAPPRFFDDIAAEIPKHLDDMRS